MWCVGEGVGVGVEWVVGWVRILHTYRPPPTSTLAPIPTCPIFFDT